MHFNISQNWKHYLKLYPFHTKAENVKILRDFNSARAQARVKASWLAWNVNKIAQQFDINSSSGSECWDYRKLQIFFFLSKAAKLTWKWPGCGLWRQSSAKLAGCRAADTGNYKTFNNHQQSIMMTYSHRAKAYAYLKRTVCLWILPQRNTATYTTSRYSERVHALHPKSKLIIYPG